MNFSTATTALQYYNIRARELVSNFMRFNERAEDFDVKHEKFHDVAIIPREYKKTFCGKQSKTYWYSNIDIPGGKTNKNNKNDIF